MGAQQHGHVFGQAKVKSLLGCGGVEELLMKLGSALWELQKQQTQGIALNTTAITTQRCQQSPDRHTTLRASSSCAVFGMATGDVTGLKKKKKRQLLSYVLNPLSGLR